MESAGGDGSIKVRLAWIVAGTLLSAQLFAASISFTAVGSGYYRVMKNDVQFSQHTTEREALESLANVLLGDPAANVYMYHDYRVEGAVDGLGGTTPPVIDPTGSFPLTWTPPDTRADGTALPIDQIDGYKVYYGTTTGNYTNTVDVAGGATTSITISGLAVGTYYIVMTTVDTAGKESAYSSEVVKTVQ